MMPGGAALGALLLACAGIAGCGATQAAGDVALEIEAQPGDPGRVRAVLQGPGVAQFRRFLGRNPSAQAVEEAFYLAVAPAPGAAATRPIPLLAHLEGDDRRAVLIPQVSLTRGLAYQAVFDGPRLSASLPRLTREYRVPLDGQPSDSRITAVYPRQEEVPANLLKFYVHFSRPMGQGRLFQHARLLDAGGKPVAQAFREVELWDSDHKRLTLWINPGRTKRSLGLSESLGPVLEEGRSYTLEIAPGLTDQRGRPLAAAFRHPFRTVAPDRAQPRIEDWRLDTPAPRTTAPLSVRFPEPLDHALASRVIRVERAGQPVEGAVSLDEECRRWSFAPRAPWQAGEYRLTAGGELEDLAGNSLQRPFETPEGQGRQPVPSPSAFHRTFTVAP